jgi:hypothetical protein
MKMEQIECSETSAYNIQTPENHPEENIQHFYLFIFIYLFDPQSEYTGFHKLMCWQESTSLWTVWNVRQV